MMRRRLELVFSCAVSAVVVLGRVQSLVVVAIFSVLVSSSSPLVAQEIHLRPGGIAATSGIRWAESVREAFRLAKEQQKFVLVHVFSDLDLPSYSTDRLWAHQAVIREISNRFIPLRFNYKDVNFLALARKKKRLDPETFEFLESLRVPSLPFFAIVDPEGEELRRLGTTISVPEFMDFLAFEESEIRESALVRLQLMRASWRASLLFLYDSTPFGGTWCGGVSETEPLVYDVTVRTLKRKYSTFVSFMSADLYYERNKALGERLGVTDIKGTHSVILFERDGREKRRFLGRMLLKDLEDEIRGLLRGR